MKSIFQKICTPERRKKASEFFKKTFWLNSINISLEQILIWCTRVFFAIIILFLYHFTINIYMMIYQKTFPSEINLGTVGDSVAVIAVMLLIYSVFQNTKSLKMQQTELELTRDEIREQKEAIQEQASLLKTQNKLLETEQSYVAFWKLYNGNSSPERVTALSDLRKLGHKTFRGVKLSACDLSGIDLEDCCLYGAVLNDTSFRGNNLKSIKLHHITAEKVTFVGGSLNDAQIINGICKRAEFESIQLDNIVFRDSDFEGATFSKVQMSNPQFENSNLKMSWIKSCEKIPGFKAKNSNMNNCHILHSNFWKGEFIEANLQQATLRTCDFDDCDFSNADLENAGIHDTSFKECKFEGASLNRIRLYNTQITLEQICSCQSIEWIEGLEMDLLEEIKELRPDLMKWWDYWEKSTIRENTPEWSKEWKNAKENYQEYVKEQINKILGD